ncbi:MAG: hypothetical protein R3208_16320 [Ketobacteraceae bacterium]|nr:hypothetical protein [Ketobacteraceae bacterium]
MNKAIMLSSVLMIASAPSVADNASDWDTAWDEFEQVAETPEEPSPFSWNTSVEAAMSARLRDDPAISRDTVLAELRNRWNVFYDSDNVNLTYKADFLLDDLRSDHHYETREANIFYRPATYMEFKAGRQILTWGTGDLIFLNDLFPKDWQSFFAGRDDRYLKAPSDAIKVSAFSDLVNIDVVYTPEFDSDIYISGERISYYSPMAGQVVAAPPRLSPRDRDNTFEDSELAVRLSKNLKGAEYAIYFYDGFYKSPVGFDPDAATALFPALRVWGASYRAPWFGGIGNLEVADYRSLDDPGGNDPFIPNDQQRYLLGFERELLANFTFALQYYLEITGDYDELEEHSPDPASEQEEYRRVWTNRLTYRVLNGNLTYSFFTFYSPSDQDGYLRPALDYRYSDQLQVSIGGNIFFGDDPYTFFNRFEYNSNLYMRVKYYL